MSSSSSSSSSSLLGLSHDNTSDIIKLLKDINQHFEYFMIETNVAILSLSDQKPYQDLFSSQFSTLSSDESNHMIRHLKKLHKILSKLHILKTSKTEHIDLKDGSLVNAKSLLFKDFVLSESIDNVIQFTISKGFSSRPKQIRSLQPELIEHESSEEESLESFVVSSEEESEEFVIESRPYHSEIIESNPENIIQDTALNATV